MEKYSHNSSYPPHFLLFIQMWVANQHPSEITINFLTSFFVYSSRQPAQLVPIGTSKINPSETDLTFDSRKEKLLVLQPHKTSISGWQHSFLLLFRAWSFTWSAFSLAGRNLIEILIKIKTTSKNLHYCHRPQFNCILFHLVTAKTHASEDCSNSSHRLQALYPAISIISLQMSRGLDTQLL